MENMFTPAYQQTPSRAIDEVTESARKSMDEISAQAAKAAKAMHIT